MYLRVIEFVNFAMILRNVYDRYMRLVAILNEFRPLEVNELELARLCPMEFVNFVEAQRMNLLTDERKWFSLHCSE